ncbi:MAG: radical SAM protein [Candidatus Syntrophosphaera sp.]
MPENDKPKGLNRFSSVGWIATHLYHYLRLNADVVSHGIPLRELITLKYPFKLPDAPKPPLLSIDFTDACDLKCVYCNNPLFPHPRTFMSDEVFACLVRRQKEAKINRIRIGGGEPMLHPKCASMLKELAPLTRYLSIISNGQWKDPHAIDPILASGVDMIEISIDAGGAEVYESSREGASYPRLLKNVRHLRKLRDSLKARTFIKIRLMLRPSTKHLERRETHFWRKYADSVLPQMLIKHPESDYARDVFYAPSETEATIPVCSIPFKDIQIRPDGRIPLCPAKGCSIDPDRRHFLGDICANSLLEIWKGDEMTELRKAHRAREGDILEGCRGCNYS